MSAVSNTVDTVRDALGKKIGPLPAGAWLIALGGGIFLAVIIRRSMLAGGDAEPVEAGDPTEAGGDYTGGTGWDTPDPGGTTPGVGGSVGDGVSGDGSYPQNPADTPADPDNGGPAVNTNTHVYKARNAKTNPEWRTHAVPAMVNRGWAAGVVDTALGKYLSGVPLNTREGVVVAAAVGVCGPPPVAPRPKPHAPAPTKPKPAQPDPADRHPFVRGGKAGTCKRCGKPRAWARHNVTKKGGTR